MPQVPEACVVHEAHSEAKIHFQPVESITVKQAVLAAHGRPHSGAGEYTLKEAAAGS